MASVSEFENLDEEVKELLKNYKYKKATIYEPCTLENIKECLIGLNEELGVLDINYIFNPYIDIENDILAPESLVKLINSTWSLLHYYKRTKEKADELLEQNHILEHQNKHLNGALSKFRDKIVTEKNEARACVLSAQRVSDRSEEINQTLIQSKAKLLKISKQKEAVEKHLRNEVMRLKQENDKLLDRLRGKSNVHKSCSDVCDDTVSRLKDRERKHLAVISQLQSNNQELLREVLTLKEEIIIGGIQSFNVGNKNK